MQVSHRRGLLAAMLAAGAALPGAPRAQAAPLQLGVMPNVSARILITQYQPYRLWLEERLGRPVEVVTAPGLQAFFERAVAGAYDLAVMAANLARVAQVDGGMRAVGIYEPRIQCVMVTLRERPIASIEALRGRQVAMTNPQSLVALRFRHWLRRNAGMEIGRDVTGLHARNEDSLAQLLTRGDTPLAVMSGIEFAAIREEIRSTLLIWRNWEAVPGFLTMSRAAMPEAESERLRALLATFPATEAGREFARLTGFTNLRPPTQGELEELDDLVAETRQLLGRG